MNIFLHSILSTQYSHYRQYLTMNKLLIITEEKNQTGRLYCIRGKFCPSFIFALFAHRPEGEFKTGLIFYKGLYMKIWERVNLRQGESVKDLYRAEIRLGEIKAVYSIVLKILSWLMGGGP